MDICPNCGASLEIYHILTDDRIPKMTNGDRIIAPVCAFCLQRLPVHPLLRSADSNQQVLLITGLCGAGKSSVGKLLEQRTGYIHIDGDAVSKRVNWDIRNGYLSHRSGYRVFDELLETIQIVLQLGYSVAATYVFTEEAIRQYEAVLSSMNIPCKVVILKTNKDVCIQRDRQRECWTAGEAFVSKWMDEQDALAAGGIWPVIDNSSDPLEETCRKIIRLL